MAKIKSQRPRPRQPANPPVAVAASERSPLSDSATWDGFFNAPGIDLGDRIQPPLPPCDTVSRLGGRNDSKREENAVIPQPKC